MRSRPILLSIGFCVSIAAAFVLGRDTSTQATVARGTVAPLHAPALAPKDAVNTSAPSHPGLLGLFGWGAVAPPVSEGDTSPPDIDAIASYEDLMYAQPDLVDASLKRLRAKTPGKVNLYALGFAGDAEERVFRNEVDFLPKLLAQRFDAEGHTLQLINSPDTFGKTPLATRTNLFDALSGIGDAMDRDNDILLLFLTSHGSHDHQLYVEMGTLPLDQLTPHDIRDALDKARIRWRVIVISACYSGGFVPALREPHTMIITAARTDRTSFGCGNDSQITWFGRAFLTEALNQTTDFHAAYLQAKKTIAGWEQRDHFTPSEPQFWEGPLIEGKLAAWRATLPAPAPQVPFVPTAIAAKSARGQRQGP